MGNPYEIARHVLESTADGAEREQATMPGRPTFPRHRSRR